jgi:CheY-like chemotaxis protein
MKKTILIVEDNPLNMELTTQLLEDDYALITAEDGVIGVEMAKDHKPDLILMDLSLPRMDGWEATRQLRAEWSTCRIPIVALTAHAVKGDVDRALEAGCDAYVTKPIDEDFLMETIARFIGD